ncbi:MAG TPA: hypothetical protein VKT49_24870 [Bryobacteraceae bacterium]|nr:hypothetical protein [Bryobacteraceae bacterium]
MAVVCAGLGFRLHTGWAALVAIAEPDKIEVVLRRRVELLPADDSIPRFVYHSAAEMDRAEAAALVKRSARAAEKTAGAALRETLDELRRMKIAVKTAGIPTGSTVPPRELDRILKSHPLIHAAEGALFQAAVARGCQECGLKITTVREKELLERAAEACGTEPARFRKSLDDMRKNAGPPWGVDQKTAAAAALLALRLAPLP